MTWCTYAMRSSCSEVVAVSNVAVVAVVVEAGDGFEAEIGTDDKVGVGAAVGVVSVLRFSNEPCKAAIAFRMLSGNGPVRDSAQYCSIRSSFTSTFATVSQSSLTFTSHAGAVAGSV